MIEKIIHRKNKDIITFNGKEYDFSKEIVFKEGLREKQEIVPKEFFEIKEKSDCILAKNYLFTLLASRIKSLKECQQKLRQKGFFTKAIDYAIGKAIEYRLLDDDNFAKCYVNSHINHKGGKMIRYELIKKGVDESIIDKYLIDTIEEQRQTALRHAMKYLKIKGAKATRDKLFRHLYSKGFDYELITEVMAEVKSQLEELK